MRVLHLSNIADVPPTLSKYLRKNNIKSVVVVFRKDPFGFEYDYNMNVDRYPRFIQSTVRFHDLFRYFRNYDIYHLHSSSFLPFYVDAPLLRIMKKKIIYHHHGSDVRYKGIPFFSKFGHLRLVSTPDLLEYAKDAIWIPNPVDIEKTDKIANKVNKNNSLDLDKDKIYILYSPRGQYNIRGTFFIENVLKNIISKYKEVKIIKVENLPKKEFLIKVANADIIIDGLIIGWYGVLSIEAMALKKPVCCYLREDLKEKYAPNCPIINSTPENLQGNLEMLIEDEKLRYEIGKKSRRYVKKIHDAKVIVKKLIKMYNILIGDKNGV